MIKVSVIYPCSDDSQFDIDYYCESHMPMVQGLLGEACTGIAAEEGIAGGAPGAPAPYHAMGHLYFNSIEDFQTSFGPNAEQIMADVPNYTNVDPTLVVSKVRIA
ncbi:MAG: EthD family reductase [Gammaproteobacteria bacterium]